MAWNGFGGFGAIHHGGHIPNMRGFQRRMQVYSPAFLAIEKPDTAASMEQGDKVVLFHGLLRELHDQLDMMASTGQPLILEVTHTLGAGAAGGGKGAANLKGKGSNSIGPGSGTGVGVGAAAVSAAASSSASSSGGGSVSGSSSRGGDQAGPHAANSTATNGTGPADAAAAGAGGNSAGSSALPPLSPAPAPASITKRVHVGVLEFSGEQHNVVYMPSWLMHGLLCEEGTMLNFRLRSLPSITYLRLQPSDNSFVQSVSEPKLALEEALRSFTAVTLDQELVIPVHDVPYSFRVLEVRPENATKGASLVHADCELVFDVPESEGGSSSSSGAAAGAEVGAADGLASVAGIAASAGADHGLAGLVDEDVDPELAAAIAASLGQDVVGTDGGGGSSRGSACGPTSAPSSAPGSRPASSLGPAPSPSTINWGGSSSIGNGASSNGGGGSGRVTPATIPPSPGISGKAGPSTQLYDASRPGKLEAADPSAHPESLSGAIGHRQTCYFTCIVRDDNVGLRVRVTASTACSGAASGSASGSTASAAAAAAGAGSGSSLLPGSGLPSSSSSSASASSTPSHHAEVDIFVSASPTMTKPSRRLFTWCDVSVKSEKSLDILPNDASFPVPNTTTGSRVFYVCLEGHLAGGSSDSALQFTITAETIQPPATASAAASSSSSSAASATAAAAAWPPFGVVPTAQSSTTSSQPMLLPLSGVIVDTACRSGITGIEALMRGQDVKLANGSSAGASDVVAGGGIDLTADTTGFANETTPFATSATAAVPSPSSSSASSAASPPLPPPAAAALPAADTRMCETCGAAIPTRTYDMHSSFCRRNNWRCGQCGLVMQVKAKGTHVHCPVVGCGGIVGGKEELEKHNDLCHASHPCETCGTVIIVAQPTASAPFGGVGILTSTALYQRHVTSECPLRKVQCMYCKMTLTLKARHDHEVKCGARTVPCDACGRMVIRKRLEGHIASGCAPESGQTPATPFLARPNPSNALPGGDDEFSLDGLSSIGAAALGLGQGSLWGPARSGGGGSASAVAAAGPAPAAAAGSARSAAREISFNDLYDDDDNDDDGYNYDGDDSDDGDAAAEGEAFRALHAAEGGSRGGASRSTGSGGGGSGGVHVTSPRLLGPDAVSCPSCSTTLPSFDDLQIHLLSECPKRGSDSHRGIVEGLLGEEAAGMIHVDPEAASRDAGAAAISSGGANESGATAAAAVDTSENMVVDSPSSSSSQQTAPASSARTDAAAPPTSSAPAPVPSAPAAPAAPSAAGPAPGPAAANPYRRLACPCCGRVFTGVEEDDVQVHILTDCATPWPDTEAAFRAIRRAPVASGSSSAASVTGAAGGSAPSVPALPFATDLRAAVRSRIGLPSSIFNDGGAGMDRVAGSATGIVAGSVVVEEDEDAALAAAIAASMADDAGSSGGGGNGTSATASAPAPSVPSSSFEFASIMGSGGDGAPSASTTVPATSSLSTASAPAAVTSTPVPRDGSTAALTAAGVPLLGSTQSRSAAGFAALIDDDDDDDASEAEYNGAAGAVTPAPSAPAAVPPAAPLSSRTSASAAPAIINARGPECPSCGARLPPTANPLAADGVAASGGGANDVADHEALQVHMLTECPHAAENAARMFGE